MQFRGKATATRTWASDCRSIHGIIDAIRRGLGSGRRIAPVIRTLFGGGYPRVIEQHTCNHSFRSWFILVFPVCEFRQSRRFASPPVPVRSTVKFNSPPSLGHPYISACISAWREARSALRVCVPVLLESPPIDLPPEPGAGSQSEVTEHGHRIDLRDGHHVGRLRRPLRACAARAHRRHCRHRLGRGREADGNADGYVGYFR
jgi:hypothetical protein